MNAEQELRSAVRNCVESHLAPWANYADKTEEATNAFVASLSPLVSRLQRERDEAVDVEISALQVELSEARDEAKGLRANMDQRIRDFLSERVCCDGTECGCMGMTRLQQFIAEETGTEITALRQRAEAAEKELAEAKAALACIKDRVQFDDDFSADEIVEYITTRVGKYSQGIDWIRERVIQELEADLSRSREDRETLDWLASRCYRSPGPASKQLVYVIVDSSVWPAGACRDDERPNLFREACSAARSDAKGASGS